MRSRRSFQSSLLSGSANKGPAFHDSLSLKRTRLLIAETIFVALKSPLEYVNERYQLRDVNLPTSQQLHTNRQYINNGNGSSRYQIRLPFENFFQNWTLLTVSVASCYLKGVSVKISEKYRPPRRPTLPPGLNHFESPTHLFCENVRLLHYFFFILDFL